ncbi:MAG: hypothetical protein V9F05_12860 [Chitinophagaceae bacterium]
MKNQIQQFLSIAALIIIPTYLTAQDPDIIWQKTVGGAEDDILHQVRHTADGGAILGGTSLSQVLDTTKRPILPEVLLGMKIIGW